MLLEPEYYMLPESEGNYADMTLGVYDAFDHQYSANSGEHDCEQNQAPNDVMPPPGLEDVVPTAPPGLEAYTDSMLAPRPQDAGCEPLMVRLNRDFHGFASLEPATSMMSDKNFSEQSPMDSCRLTVADLYTYFHNGTLPTSLTTEEEKEEEEVPVEALTEADSTTQQEVPDFASKSHETSSTESQPDQHDMAVDSSTSNSEASGLVPEGCTTLMLRNIPNKYTMDMLVEHLHKSSGYKGELDFLYLPIDFKNKCNVGYAFLNFRSESASSQFAEEYHLGNSWEKLSGFHSKKVCEVSPARFQGCAENVRRLQQSPVMAQLAGKPEWLPRLFNEKGAAVDFPIPEKASGSSTTQVSARVGRLPRSSRTMS